MTKKHFKALAEIVRAAGDGRPHNTGHDYELALSLPQRERLAQELAEVCSDANPRFRRQDFYEACNLPELAARYAYH